MNCPNCGAALPDGSTYCSICAMPIQESLSGGMMFQEQPSGNMMLQQQTAGNMMFQQPVPPRRRTALVGIIISAIVILAVTFLVSFYTLGGRYNGTYMLDPDCRYNGIYMLDTVSMDGIAISASELASYGMTDIGIKVSSGRCSLIGNESLGLDNFGESRIKFTDDTVTIIDSDGTKATGSFDGSSFTIESSGVFMTFVRTSDLTPDDMSGMGIKVSFGKCTLIGEDAFNLGHRPKLKFSDDTVTLTTADGTIVKGSFNGKSFTVELDGFLIRFTKK